MLPLPLTSILLMTSIKWRSELQWTTLSSTSRFPKCPSVSAIRWAAVANLHIHSHATIMSLFITVANGHEQKQRSQNRKHHSHISCLSQWNIIIMISGWIPVLTNLRSVCCEIQFCWALTCLSSFREKRAAWTGRTWTWFCLVWSTTTTPGPGSTLPWLWKETAGKHSWHRYTKLYFRPHQINCHQKWTLHSVSQLLHYSHILLNMNLLADQCIHHCQG